MAELKTKENNASVESFIKNIKDEQKRKDSLRLLDIFRDVTKEDAKMRGSAIIGLENIIINQKKANRKEIGR